MRNFTKYLLAVMTIVLSSSVMHAQLRVSSSSGGAPVLPDSRAVLYQQTNSAGAGQASQDFEAFYDIYDCQGADDFYVPAGVMWNIETVTATGSGSTTANVANVFIYDDAGGKPANSATISLMGLACTNAASVLAINIPGGILLGPGHYWISVQDAAEYATNGQWFWTLTSSIYNSGSCWRNPGNAFGTGAITWTTMAALGYPNSDFMFRLDGASGPQTMCIYKIALYDTFGDGWNGCSIDVLVDGAIVLDNITLASGSGPADFYFNVSYGGMITTTFTAGSWVCEPYYYVYNSVGAQVYYVPANCNPPVITTGQLYANCPVYGNVEGYVYDYDGLAISGAAVAIQGSGPTTSGPDGYYLLEGLIPGNITMTCTKAGYNQAFDVVIVMAISKITHNFTLTQPAMEITPGSLYEVLLPTEMSTTNLYMTNSGSGSLGWSASINYAAPVNLPLGSGAEVSPPSKYIPGENSSIGPGNGIALGEDGSRDMMLCPDGSIFGIPPAGSNHG
jgi:hypothetical protein